nr:MAG TPA: hypothetical protein [Herelleviridae sp.]
MMIEGRYRKIICKKPQIMLGIFDICFTSDRNPLFGTSILKRLLFIDESFIIDANERMF